MSSVIELSPDLGGGAAAYYAWNVLGARLGPRGSLIFAVVRPGLAPISVRREQETDILELRIDERAAVGYSVVAVTDSPSLRAAAVKADWWSR